ncbi:MAG: hypothetical protein F4100_05670 [Rhodothermaceae bacterium]|nr:hypothetical protein [Rhodothermaceae bacterium]MYE63502.1 hypothetical protein [Rhodothermaceae bacterium]MYJ20220.1 hypothetical protein [Rhodothermaceae bacterium]
MGDIRIQTKGFCKSLVFLIMGLCGLIVPLPGVAKGSSNISIIAATLLTFPLLWTLRSKKLTLLGGLGLFLGFLFSSGGSTGNQTGGSDFRLASYWFHHTAKLSKVT